MAVTHGLIDLLAIHGNLLREPMSVGIIRKHRLLFRFRQTYLGMLTLQPANEVVPSWYHRESKQKRDEEAQEDSECHSLSVFQYCLTSSE